MFIILQNKSFLPNSSPILILDIDCTLLYLFINKTSFTFLIKMKKKILLQTTFFNHQQLFVILILHFFLFFIFYFLFEDLNKY